MEKKKYIPGSSVEEAKKALEDHKGKKPGSYQSQWKDPADQLLSKLQNRGPFSYDAGKDPLYRQAVDQYVRLGRQAMMDTVGKVSALTGGYGNSYALTAGQQTYGGYLQALAAKLPQFQDMAMKRYQAEGKDLLDRYSALSQREKEAYGRYQQILNAYYAQQDRLQSAYDRQQTQDYDRFKNERDYQYGLDRDALEDAAKAEAARRDQERWEAERKYQQQRDEIEDQQWEREFKENRRRYEREWAAKHAPADSGGGSGGTGIPAIDFGKYQKQHSMTDKEYEAAKKRAQENGHYNGRFSGDPWSPRYDGLTRPHYRVTI